MANQSNYHGDGNHSYYPSLPPLSRELGPPLDFPPRPIEIDLNASGTMLPQEVEDISYASSDVTKMAPIDGYRHPQDPIVQWYTVNDEPWIPHKVSQEIVSDRLPSEHLYRHTNPLEARSLSQYNVPNSDSGYGSRRSIGDDSIFSVDQDYQSLTSHKIIPEIVGSGLPSKHSYRLTNPWEAHEFSSRFTNMDSSRLRPKGSQSDSFNSLSSTISRDNTTGECARNSKLLAEFGQKSRKETLARPPDPHPGSFLNGMTVQQMAMARQQQMQQGAAITNWKDGPNGQMIPKGTSLRSSPAGSSSRHSLLAVREAQLEREAALQIEREQILQREQEDAKEYLRSNIEPRAEFQRIIKPRQFSQRQSSRSPVKAVALPNSPLLKQMNIKLRPSPSPEPLISLSSDSLESSPDVETHMAGSRPKYRRSPGDAVLVSWMANGKHVDDRVSRRPASLVRAERFSRRSLSPDEAAFIRRPVRMSRDNSF